MTTAQDLINNTDWEYDGFQQTITLANVEKLMIEFAKLHVEATLKACLDKFNNSIVENYSFGSSKIMNSYPLNNIK